MSIENKISVNTHYTRSTNLKRDSKSEVVTRSYIPTSRALRTLDQMVDALSKDEAPRAWSLVGPYGSGKSTFAVFAANLLGNVEDSSTQIASDVLSQSSTEVAERYQLLTAKTEGYCTVLMTGSPAPLGKSLVIALNESVQQIWSKRRGKNPEVVEMLEWEATSSAETTVAEAVEIVKGVQDALARIGYAGLLIVIDELGKFLEYEARHYGANEIYLLQELAEHAYSKHKTKLALMVMLHQSIDQYARGLGESLKNEWAKVQGRFENVSFIESTEQTLRIVAAAVQQDLTATEQKRIEKESRKLAVVLSKEKAVSSGMDKEVAAEVFGDCYPLHPVSALLLPILCQKVAQNERTLFSYLGSKEAHGFLDSVKRCEAVGDWIYPWEIFEYFIRNQPASISDHYTHRRWAEVLTALERVGDVEEPVEYILKVIGLLNIVGGHGGLKASEQILKHCLPHSADVDRAINELKSKSVIQYRKFSSEYRVWQGSDFDLEERLIEERDKLGYFSVAEKINERHNILPVVARKYTIQSGTLRSFAPLFADRTSIGQLDLAARIPRIIFFLSESKEDEQLFIDSVVGSFSNQDLVVLVPNGEQTREVVGEALALEQVECTSQELNTDPVALREYRDTYEVALSHESNILSLMLENPQCNQWFWRDEKLEIDTKRKLQEALSLVLSNVYHATPVFKNELINRDKTSAQANSARNKLIFALVNHQNEEDLGIEKFPAEKSIYRAVLKATGLHAKNNQGNWELAKSEDFEQGEDPYNLTPLWRRIDSFLTETEHSPCSMVELNKELFAPPYGIKEGMLPLLYSVAMLAYSDELAITEDGAYVPYVTFEHLERFIKRPDKFTVQRVKIEGVNRKIIMEYSKALFADGGQRTMLEIAKPIAKFIDDLPAYTKQTDSLQVATKAVRDAFKLSKSPVKLLLEDLPKALGMKLTEVSDLSVLLTNALRELKYAHAEMVQQMVELIAESVSAKGKDLKSAKEAICSRSYGLENYTVDEHGLKGFVMRLHRDQVEDEVWLESVLMFLGGRPSAKWTDANRIAAEYKFTSLMKKMRDLEKLRIGFDGYKSGDQQSDVDVYLLKSTKIGATENDEVVVVDKGLRATASVVKQDLLQILQDSAVDQKVAIAALAELVDDVLLERSGVGSKKKSGEVEKLKAVAGGEK
ncbi:MAG: hypothetical protein HON27_17845 [Candidatus Marinimicrobia bacterium]|jgi:hypothetical protein|nr:hypothetical protein [Candidatus Neomarinimicrobiota bacterium]MBT4948012.1 hypothetical protein [Candidatus Neomarinimicrobiota bacterium]MBT5269786.1 hypothetical protein [Candidatus Neomarinimicrobiota bacterium]